MKRILHVIHGLNVGGAETFITNLIENSNNGEYQFAFAIQNPDITNERIRRLIAKHGIKVHIIPAFPRHLFKQIWALRKLIRDNSYDIVHYHANALLNPSPVIATRLENVVMILHSHCTRNQIGGMAGYIVHQINRKLFANRKIIRVACSDLAGRWMFGTKGFKVIMNAISIDDYAFSEIGRSIVRQQYSISDDYIVLGSIGRLVPAKNHTFILSIFQQFNQRHPKSKLLIVGDGILYDKLTKESELLGIANNVIFTGTRTDTRNCYSAMDCFLMPSLFEGLGFTAVEAQANGLPAVISSNVPRNTQVSDNVIFTPPPSNTPHIATTRALSICIKTA